MNNEPSKISDSWPGYNSLELAGVLLKTGFSIYLMELCYQGTKYFYLGMTGDPYYPSARSAFHRISGHLELAKRSTQNQLGKALSEIGIKSENYSELSITMHHSPVEGYQEWTLSSFHHEKLKKHLGSDEYLSYKSIQSKVNGLENSLVGILKSELNGRLLNKTQGHQKEVGQEFIPLKNQILEIVKNS